MVVSGFVLFLGLKAPWALGQVEPTRKLKLIVGETQTISMPEGDDLSVSQRGIVDLFHLGNGQWQITGLKRGFVIVAADEASKTKQRLFIEVDRKDVDARSQTPGAKSPDVAKEALSWLCMTPGVSCDFAKAVITGLTSRPLWFFAAKKLAERSGYIFAVELTPAAKDAWIQMLQRSLGPNFSVAFHSMQLPIAESSCGKEGRKALAALADSLTDKSVSKGQLIVRCFEETESRHFRLKARIFLMEEATARQLGFESSLKLSQSWLPFTQEHSLSTALKALQLENKAEIIGEPVVIIRGGEEIELHTGGEFHVAEERDDGKLRSSWKQHGLKLKLALKPVSEERVRLIYNISLRTRTSSNEVPALSLNELRSDVELQLNLPMVAGILDLKSSGERQRSQPLLANLPLLGPLFRVAGDEHSKSRLYVWFSVDQNDTYDKSPDHDATFPQGAKEEFRMKK